MLMPLYIVLAVVLYGILADRTDRATERDMRQRRPGESDPRLVEDFDVRPDLGPRHGRRVGLNSRLRSRTRLGR
jgi:hypothetical protein